MRETTIRDFTILNRPIRVSIAASPRPSRHPYSSGRGRPLGEKGMGRAHWQGSALAKLDTRTPGRIMLNGGRHLRGGQAAGVEKKGKRREGVHFFFPIFPAWVVSLCHCRLSLLHPGSAKQQPRLSDGDLTGPRSNSVPWKHEANPLKSCQVPYRDRIAIERAKPPKVCLSVST